MCRAVDKEKWDCLAQLLGDDGIVPMTEGGFKFCHD
jgi:hypothetical protein